VQLNIEVGLLGKLFKSLQFAEKVLLLGLYSRNHGGQGTHYKRVEGYANEHPDAGHKYFVRVVGAEVTVADGCEGLKGPI